MDESPELSRGSRLKALKETGLLGSPREAQFDQLTRLAARLLDTPAAFVTVISDDQQFIKSAATAEAPDLTGESQPLDRSFCKFVVASKDPLLVEDARQHELVRENKAVAAGVIAYAGVPLETRSGEAIGALCVVDSKPRKWSDDDLNNLHLLARSAMKLIDERTKAPQERSESGPDQANDLLSCTVQHLQTLDHYSALLGSSQQVALEEEAAGRGAVKKTYCSLKDLFREGPVSGAGAEIESEPLVRAVELYVVASEERERAGRNFAEGSVGLTRLESHIRKQMDALDYLRVVVLHSGAEL